MTSRERRILLSPELPFGIEGNQRFVDLVARSRTYLEYGAGASTLCAFEMVPRTVTVESDGHFLRMIERRCSLHRRERKHEQSAFIHANIGPTGTWGKPLFPSFPRPKTWKTYASAPWAKLGRDFRADVILVDGRFRVACALTVALQQQNSSWLLMFDDYAERREYWATENFLRLKERCGRMAIFEPSPSMDRKAASLALEHYLRDWR